MLPSELRRSLALRTLGVTSLGATLATLCTAGYAGTFELLRDDELTALTLSTWLAGTAWAVSLRSRRRFGKKGEPVGWWLGLPCVVFASGLTVALWLGMHRGTLGLGGFLVGSTLGLVFALPGAAALGMIFVPLVAKARDWSSTGLEGHERGETLVGAISALLASAGLGYAWLLPSLRVPPWGWSNPRLVLLSVAALAIVTGLGAAGLALLRRARRARLIPALGHGAFAGLSCETRDGVRRVVWDDPTYRAEPCVAVVLEGAGVARVGGVAGTASVASVPRQSTRGAR